MSTKPAPHDCPGCRHQRVPYERLACPRCWTRLPKPYRDALNLAFRRGTPESHQAALQAALAWYRDHPRGA